MKKFNFKALLIIVLVLIMAFALVACDHGQDPEDPTEPEDPGPTTSTLTSREYFDNMFTLVTKKGADKVEGENLKVHFDVQFGMGAASAGSHTPKNNAYAKLGLDVTVALDRTTPDAAKNTGAKVRIYVPTSVGETDICTVYATLDDAGKNIYAEVGGQKVCIPVGGIRIDGKCYDDLDELLAQKLADTTLKDLNGVPVNDIISAVTDGMGTEWTIDSFITGILNLVNRIDPTFDLEAKMKGINISGFNLGSLLPTILLGSGKGYDDLFVEGKLQVNKILQGKLFNSMFDTVPMTTANGVKTYRAIMNKDLWKIIDGMLPTSVKSPHIELTYKEKDNEIDEFKLYLQTTAESTHFNDATGSICTPFVELLIKDFDIEKNNSASAAQAIGLDASKYGTDLAFNVEAQVDLKGFSVNPSKFHSDAAYDSVGSINLTGKITVGVNVSLKTDNIIKTIKANAYAKIGNERFLGVSYNNNKITVIADNRVQLNGHSVVSTVFNLFGDAIYKQFSKWFADYPSTLSNIEAALFNSSDGVYDHTSFNTNFKGIVVHFNLSQEFDKFKADVEKAVAGLKTYLKTWANDNNIDTLSEYMKALKEFKNTYDDWSDKLKAAVKDILDDKTPTPPAKPQATATTAVSEEFAKDHWKDYLEAAIYILQKAAASSTTTDGALTIQLQDVLATISDLYNKIPREKGDAWSADYCKQEMVNWLNKKFDKLDDKKVAEKLATGITIDGVAAYNPSATGADPVKYLVDALFNTLKAKVTLSCVDGYNIDIVAEVTSDASAHVSVTLKTVAATVVEDYYTLYAAGSGWTEFNEP